MPVLVLVDGQVSRVVLSGDQKIPHRGEEGRPELMNAAEQKTCNLIESTLGESSAFRRVEDRMYVVKQGSSYVMINVLPWGKERAIVRCVAQLVEGVRMDDRLARELLILNAKLRFGAFAYVKEGERVFFLHSILGGETLDAAELVATIRDVALTSDEWDDRIMAHCGGQRMQDLITDTAWQRIFGGEFQPDQISVATAH